MKVAFATLDGRHVHGELRRAPLVAIYDVRAGGWQLDRVSSFDEGGHRSQQRIQAIEGVSIAYGAAVGPSTAARLAARGIRPATAPDGTAIEALLAHLSSILAAHAAEATGCA